MRQAPSVAKNPTQQPAAQQPVKWRCKYENTAFGKQWVIYDEKGKMRLANQDQGAVVNAAMKIAKARGLNVQVVFDDSHLKERKVS